MADELREFSRHYEYCYFSGKVKENDSPKPFMLAGQVTKTSFGAFCKNDGGREEQVALRNETVFNKDLFFPLIPAAGYYNLLGGKDLRAAAVYLSLSPDRQYRKALCMEHASSLALVPTGSNRSVEERYAHQRGFKNFNADLYRLAEAICAGKAREYPSLRNALAMAEEAKSAESVAFSKYFAIALVRGFKYPVLVHKQQKSGFFVHGRLFVNDAIYPLRDLFNKRWDLDFQNIRSFS